MLPIYCKTERAVLVLGVFDERKVMYFVNDDLPSPGINLEISGTTPMNQLIAERIMDQFGGSADFNIYQEFQEVFADEDGIETTLFLGELTTEGRVDSEWPTMPEILRSMPKNKSRVAYLKAWQVLTGGLQLNTKAVEVSEVKKALNIED